MATNAQQQWQFAERVHKELQAKLKDKDALFEDIEHLIEQLRIACESTIFLDFDYATSENVEAKLWDAHSIINNKYRKIVARYKTEDQKKHVVEKRKWEKRYADFLKTSQFFYKGYIQRLASHFAGMSELRKIAHRLQLSTQTADERVQVSENTSHSILLSCHGTLLRLGDLCRYRNVLRTKNRTWEMAMAYYNLANDLYPESGNAFNQMAVISLLDFDHLHAVYYLYRALAVKEPNSMAQGNLDIEFKKITNEWTKGGVRPSNGVKSAGKASDATAPLISWFVRLHAKLYKGEEFPGHDELENEVLSQLTVLLKEQSLEDILGIFVLVNIAGEYCAGERLKENPSNENFQSYYFFLRLNVRMLFMLLQLLQPELDGPGDDGEVPDVTGNASKGNFEVITAVTRRILPALRHYSIWLVMKAPIIVAQVGNASLNVHIREMWSIYCSTLTLLVAAFPPAGLPVVDYLLEEDAATVGFKPFRDSEQCQIYTNDAGLKPRDSDPGIQRSMPNVEMLARVRDLLRDGMVLAVDDKFPVYLVDGEFRYFEDGPPISSPLSRNPSAIPSSPYNAPMTSSQYGQAPILNQVIPRPPSCTPSDSHQSMSTDMYQMVEKLVAPNNTQKNDYAITTNEPSYGMHSGTAAEVFAPMMHSSRPGSRQQTTPLQFPGVYTTPFTPQPGELGSSSPDRPSTASRLSSLHLADSSPSFVTPAFDSPTGFHSGMRNAWGNGIAPLPSLQQQGPRNVVDQLRMSLAEQYGSSSDFSHPSSLYQNTPGFGTHQQPARPFGGATYNMPYNTSTIYAGASDFDRNAMLNSSLWNSSQPARGRAGPTPPGGQGG